MKRFFCNRSLMWLIVLLAAAIAVLPACGTSSSPTPSSVAPSTSAGGNAISIDLAAQNIAFDKTTITVKAGSQVTINFNNKDSGIPHNFSLYTDSSASQNLFKGDTVTGPGTAAYKFTAPSTPGTYFFRCDIHPTQMTGQFVVQ
jgi:plastocyanin